MSRRDTLSSSPNSTDNKEVSTGQLQWTLSFRKDEKVAQSNSAIKPVPLLGSGPALWGWLSVALGSTL